MDPNSNTPIVVLKSNDSETVLPIWVGAFEANAIALEIEKIVPQRPMTHDLIRNLIVESNLRVSRIIINDLRDNTFFAVIELKTGEDNLLTLDARPSDAIALALRLDCPIYVEQKVLDISSATTLQAEAEINDIDSTNDEWADIIE